MFTGGGRRTREGRSGGEGSVLRNTVLGTGFTLPGFGVSASDQGVNYMLAKGELAGV